MHTTKMLLGRLQVQRNLFYSKYELNATPRRAKSSESTFQSIKFWVSDRVANIQLCRPKRLNAIDVNMPFELEKAVELANSDPHVKVIAQFLVI